MLAMLDKPRGEVVAEGDEGGGLCDACRAVPLAVS
jgi:hypothetical protein